MKNRMSVSRCCCIPGTVVPIVGNVTAGIWTSVEQGISNNVALVTTTDDVPLYKKTDAFGFNLTGTGPVFSFSGTSIPTGLTSAVLTFDGYVDPAYIDSSGDPQTGPEPSQTLLVYATYGAVTDYTLFKGPVSMSDSPDWETGGTVRTTPDIAAILNAVTSDAGFNPVLHAIRVLIRSSVTEVFETGTRFVVNAIGGAELTYTS